MTPSAPYQVAIIAGRPTPKTATLRKTLTGACVQLGLPPSVLHFLDETTVALADASLPLTGVYFGGTGTSPASETAVRLLRDRDAAILPVVSSLDDFTRKVPPGLHELNGFAPDSADTSLAAVANYVLQQLGLERRERMAFISYKRTESRHAALQIYHGLDDRSWGAFLDTHSISPGVKFQDTLWDKMASADVLLLLDTPGVLASRWVQEELAHAHDLGMGVLQIIWPTHTRLPGTEFCEPEYLDAGDLVGSPSRTGGARLRSAALRRIMAAIERVRARALAARRNRIVREFCASAAATGRTVTVQPGGEIEVRDGRRRAYCFIPVIGHPNSAHIHDASSRADEKQERLLVLYDAAGALPRRLEHLRWLNRHLPVATLPVHESYGWLRTA